MSFLETAFVGGLALLAIGGIAALVERRRARRDKKAASLNAANRGLNG